MDKKNNMVDSHAFHRVTISAIESDLLILAALGLLGVAAA